MNGPWNANYMTSGEYLAQSSVFFPRVCLRWQIKPTQDKPRNTKHFDYDQKIEHF